MRYTYKEFLSFCQQRNSRIRVEGDVVWYNQIPVPESLVKKVFFSAQNILSTFLDHLISAYALQAYDLQEKTSLASFAPAPSLVNEKQAELMRVLETARNMSKFAEVEDFIVKASGLKNYIRLDNGKFLKTVKHSGKKYERIYIPKKIKDYVSETAPKLNSNIGISNGDMFGNVIADELKIYRSGFSDAFAGIFKEYLEFKFEIFGNLDPSLSTLGVVEKTNYGGAGSLVLSKHMQGHLWEPGLGTKGGIDTYLNETHPLMIKENLSSEERLNLFLLAFSHEEMHLMNENDKEFVEDLRLRISNTISDFAADFT